MDHKTWEKGSVPVAVLMITLNEAHNLRETLDNLRGWASEVFILDSYSSDDTVDIALEYGVTVFQSQFKGFGPQWNLALEAFDIKSAWTMKLDPDERLTEELKNSISEIINQKVQRAITLERRLWFMGKTLPIKQKILRLWPTGHCKFSDVPVNEHPLVNLESIHASGHLEHKDSPNLEHWINKQNNYTTGEAINQVISGKLSESPKLWGSSLQRRMWLKKYFWKIPGRYLILFLYNYLGTGVFRAGKEGFYWAQLRNYVYKMWEMKTFEIKKTGRLPLKVTSSVGAPDPRVKQID